MKFFLILLFVFINVISSALIPRRHFSVAKSNFKRFPSKDDKIIKFYPKRVRMQKASTKDKPISYGRELMKGFIAGVVARAIYRLIVDDYQENEEVII